MTETVEEEQVVMTPKCKTANSTTLIIERKIVKKANDKMHVAGGEHTGIVINKESSSGKYYKVCLCIIHLDSLFIKIETIWSFENLNPRFFCFAQVPQKSFICF